MADISELDRILRSDWGMTEASVAAMRLWDPAFPFRSGFMTSDVPVLQYARAAILRKKAPGCIVFAGATALTIDALKPEDLGDVGDDFLGSPVVKRVHSPEDYVFPWELGKTVEPPTRQPHPFSLCMLDRELAFDGSMDTQIVNVAFETPERLVLTVRKPIAECVMDGLVGSSWKMPLETQPTELVIRTIPYFASSDPLFGEMLEPDGSTIEFSFA